MNLMAVMTEIAGKMSVIKGLRVADYPKGSITPPAAIVALPSSIDFDETYGRGSDKLTLFVVVLVAKSAERNATVQLAAYCSGSGAQSIKAAIEAGESDSYDDAHVTGVEFDNYKPEGGAIYAAAVFTVEITGSGA